MPKTYTVKQPYYGICIVGLGILSLLLGLFFTYALIRRAVFDTFFNAILAACFFCNFARVFVAVADPHKVIIDDTSIIFVGVGVKIRYEFESIKDFAVRDYGNRLLIRINGGDLFRGRYCIRISHMEDGAPDLRAFLLDLSQKKSKNL